MEFTKKVNWIKRDGVDYACFRMSCKGGDLPKNFEVFIDVTLSTHDVVIDKRVRDLTVSAWRIACQKMLREEAGEIVCGRLARDGLNVNIATTINKDMVMTPEDKAAQVLRYVESLPKDVRETLMKKFNDMK
jgi:hypothetical protein